MRKKDWRLWCRLCAKEDSTNNINIFFKDELQPNQCEQSGQTMENSVAFLAAIVERYFHIKFEEKLPRVLCTECLDFIKSLAKFSERLTRVQAAFSTILQNDCVKGNLDLQAIRSKYVLSITTNYEQEDLELISSRSSYFEAKPQINENEFEDNFLETSEIYVKNPLELPTQIKIKTECEKNEIDEQTSTEKEDDEEDEHDGNDDVDSNDTQNIFSTKARLPTAQQQPNFENSNNSDEEHSNDYFNCSDCSRTFKRIQGYRQHLKNVHNKDAPVLEYPCTQCSRVYTAMHKLKQHTKLHLPLELRKVLPCPYCDKKFTGNFFVKSHIKTTHMNERNFICDECGAALCSKASLQSHMLIHANYSPFQCKTCKKGFKTKSNLKRHMEIHDDTKLICPECGLQLSSSTTLSQHLLVHSNEMQHKCDYCGRAFKRSKSLKIHLILHTGLKPYTCDFCDLTFATGSNCRLHKRKAHPEEFAKLEASGGSKPYTRNIPKLSTLKALTKTAENLEPVATKQSGCFAFGRKNNMAIKR